MPTTHPIKVTVYDGAQETNSDAVIGWVSNFGCENDNCVAAVCNGKRWHATPRGFGVTLPEYHFRDLDDAIYALVKVMGQ